MYSAVVHFVDGKYQTFTGAGPLSMVLEDSWLRITDSNAILVGGVPREQVKYFTTSLNPIS